MGRFVGEDRYPEGGVIIPPERPSRANNGPVAGSNASAIMNVPDQQFCPNVPAVLNVQDHYIQSYPNC